VLPELAEDGVGQHLAGGPPAVRAQVVRGALELHPGLGAGDVENLDRLRGDFGSDAVNGDDGEPDHVSHR
jgi:hypothetical protein